MRGIFHTFFLEQEAQFQTPAMQRVPGSSPDTCGHVWILSRVRSESSSCSTAHHNSQPPTTSALTHSYKFLLLFYISITFLGQLHSLESIYFTVWVCCSLRACNRSIAMARVLALSMTAGPLVAGTQQREEHTGMTPGRDRRLNKNPWRKLEDVIILEEMNSSWPQVPGVRAAAT